MMKINDVTKIEYAPLGKRFLAFFLDLIMAVFIGLGIFIGTSRIFSNIDSINGMKVKYNNIISESFVLKVEENETVYKQWGTYEEATYDIFNFYNEFLPKYNNEKHEISNYWFNVFVLGLDDEKTMFSPDELAARTELVQSGKQLFEYKEENNTKKYDEIGIPIGYQKGNKSFNELSDDDQKKIINYFLNDNQESRSIAYYCTIEIAKLSILNDLYNDYLLWETVVPLVIGLFFGYAIFFIAMPLLLKDGKTLAKQFIKISVISSNYYSAKKSQIVLRYVPQICVACIVLLFLGFNLVTVSIFTIVVLASYIFCIFNQKHTSFHDLVAKTLVIEDDNSIWFKNKEEEDNARIDINSIVG